MQLQLADLDGLHDLANEIEEHPEHQDSPRALAAQIRRETAKLRALILADHSP